MKTASLGEAEISEGERLILFLAYVGSWELGLVQTSNFSLWAIDRFDSSNVIGLDKTKTNSFSREGLGLFLFFLLPYAWRPYCNIILAKGNSVKLAINYSKMYLLFIYFHITNSFRHLV